MAYRVRVERIGKAGRLQGSPVLYEADTEMEAVVLATYEVDVSGPGPQRVATVFDASGSLVLAYAGRTTGDQR